MDLTTLSDTELQDLADDIQTETERRWVLSQGESEVTAIEERAAGDMVRLAERYLEARDGIHDPENPPEWVQPSGAHDAYPLGRLVAHDGVTWRSKIPANATEPGNTADPQSYRWWEDLTPEPDPGDGTPAWDGNAKAYKVGDVVVYEGLEYECRQGHTSRPGWSPLAVPALWLAVAL